MPQNDDALLKLAQFTQKSKEKLASEGHAFKNSSGDASYPIRNVSDLKNAIQAFGRAKDSDKPQLKKFIMRRARALGHPELIPDSWKTVEASAEDSPVELARVTRVSAYGDWVYLGPATGTVAASKIDDLQDKLELAKGRLDWSPKKNWVEEVGGLPKYIEDIAVALIRDHGFTRERAIATAVNRVKKWAAGVGNVTPKTRAKAAAALAQWEAKKARSHAD